MHWEWVWTGLSYGLAIGAGIGGALMVIALAILGIRFIFEQTVM
jgi:hypothetical protein